MFQATISENVFLSVVIVSGAVIVIYAARCSGDRVEVELVFLYLRSYVDFFHIISPILSVGIRRREPPPDPVRFVISADSGKLDREYGVLGLYDGTVKSSEQSVYGDLVSESISVGDQGLLGYEVQ